MHPRSWSVALITAALVHASAASASPCAEQLAAFDEWLAPIKADLGKGAVMSDRVDRLVAIALRAGSPPDQPAMTLVVDAEGLHDGAGPARPAGEAAALIEGNRNLAFARTNKNAISRGIIVAAASEAPVGAVRAAVVAALASREAVWLAFRGADGQAAAPAASAVSAELDKLEAKDVSGLVAVVQREFGACDGLMAMMRKLSGQTEASRRSTLAGAPRAALEACGCKARPDVVASILWKLAFANLGVLVPVPAKGSAALPWGDGKARWADAAPAVVKALTRSK